MSMGTQVALILATVLVFSVGVVWLLFTAANTRSTQVRIAAFGALIMLVIAGLVGIAVTIDASCKDPNDRPCVGVEKEEK
jgi:hypothetical protein